ncbi:MAG: MAC/perforin domain-containing protein, partial [Bacteroidota bacterium]
NLAESTYGYTHSGVFKSREEVQHQLAVQAGVKASYMGLFSGQFSVAYDQENQSSQEFDYGYVNTFNQLGFITLSTDEKYLSAEFVRSKNALPASFDPTNPTPFFEFFRSFGAYYVSKVILGTSSQFYVAVNKTSQLSTKSISASMEASYKGFFVSGSISASVKNSESWKKFASNASVNLLYQGGDAAKAEEFAYIVNAEFPNPTEKSVQAYNAWAETHDTDPAAIDFSVNGIWNLCGAKRQAVLDAWKAYYRLRRPKVVLSGSSISDVPTSFAPPSIKLDQESFVPDTRPEHFRGMQAVVLDASQPITNTSAIRLNKYYSYAPWAEFDWTFNKMWHEMGEDLMNMYQDGDIVLLASFNIEAYSGPAGQGSGVFIELLKSIGSASSNPFMTGNQGGCTTGGEGIFLLAGQYGSPAETAIGFVFTETGGNHKSSASLQFLLYPDDSHGGYVMGDGKILSAPESGKWASSWKEL